MSLNTRSCSAPSSLAPDSVDGMILKKFRGGLLGQFVKFGVLPSVLVVVSIVAVTTYFNINSKIKDAREFATTQAKFIACKGEAFDQKAIGIVTAMSLAIENGLFAKKANTLKYLRAVAQANPMFGVFVAYEATGDAPKFLSDKPPTGEITIDQATDSSGRFAPCFLRDSTPAHVLSMLTIDNVVESEYYKKAKQDFSKDTSPKIVVTQPHLQQKEFATEFALPISIDGKFVGVVGVTRPLTFARDAIKELAIESGLNVYLLTDQNTFVTAYCGDSTATAQMQTAFENVSGQPLDKSPWAKSLQPLLSQSGKNVIGNAINPLTNTDTIHAMSRVAVNDWKVVVEIPRARLVHGIWDNLSIDLWVGIIGIIIMASLILFTAMKTVARVGAVTGGISSTAIEMSGSSREQEAVSQSFGASSVQIAAAVREISVTGGELLRKMETISKGASESSKNASKGRVGVQAMGNTMDGLASATTNVAERLSMIFEKTSSINAIVDTITKVSDQTNLLSVNAAIEAEKAGESGRGFLVVAREIRRLADQTASATLDIEKTVQQMQAAVSGGVMEMDRFSEQVRRGVTNVSEVGQRLTQVIDQVASVESSFSEVTEGMQSQVQGADQIRQAMDGLTQQASRAQEATSEFARASTSLRVSIMALRKVIGGDSAA